MPTLVDIPAVYPLGFEGLTPYEIYFEILPMYVPESLQFLKTNSFFLRRWYAIAKVFRPNVKVSGSIQLKSNILYSVDPYYGLRISDKRERESLSP